MHYKKLVLDSYQEAVRLHPTANSELKASLKAHERVPQFIDNMCKELDKVQTMAIAKRGKPYSEKHIKEIVYDMTNVFIMGVEEVARKRYESEARKYLEQRQAQERADLESSASGKLQGEYVDLVKEGGITLTDERSEV
jgi:hypothetical protein